jgi:citrate lyase alpha subunit
MAFDDGTPLDAAKLQALETELNNVKASIPKIGSSTVKIDASTSVTENKTIVQAQIAGGITTEARSIPAKGYFNETISLGLTSDPLSVVVTPFKSSGSLRDMTWTI